MGRSFIDLSLVNIWKSWFKFKKGKNPSKDLEIFNYYLENNLYRLHADLKNGKYEHGMYRKFTITDNKRREISVASVRDRIVHRLVYEYLNEIYDKTFIFDVWSCRKGKGLTGAIKRTQKLLGKYSFSFVWRADIRKFFDTVDHRMLLKILAIKISNSKTVWLLKEVIESYSVPISERERVNARIDKESPLVI